METALEKAIASLPLRSIGPAFMGGRIADIAIHPSRPNTWYVAVGSGGVWRTDNAGITWIPLFDDQPSYSIGCVRIDPSRPEVVWVGTGEAVSGRHVAWGDGVYRSDDRGHSWTRMGLERSEHVGDILIDPRDGDTVYVAAEGPLWSSGGDRGLFKTTDGGSTWERVLHVDDDTGVSSAVFAPDDPDTIHAATYQRRRRVWSFHGGGPGSGIHTSTDGGVSWRKTTAGLPNSEMGKIGLAVTSAAPELVYATIEAAEEDERGFYRSTDRGRTWERRNRYLSGGTGPHYYQELFASPTDADRIYQVDVFLHVTTDGGATFRQVEDGKHKHSDNHVVWIDPHDGQHLIVGCDAGLYETFDEGIEWRHVSNLAISQFYRVAVDNSVPFTNVLGGAQDLGTLFGPTRTAHVDGVRNQDWSVRLTADGYHAAFDPEDDDISYLSWQEGNVLRHDRRTMEMTDIQPLSGPDDPPERWNWDTPVIVSPHGSGRIYVASQRLWRSDDRGDSWTPISPDLTTGRNRYEQAVGDRVVSVDSLYDHAAMSRFGTITAVAESPVTEGVLYVGTDDGLVHVSEDGGATWRQAARPTGLSEVAFVNDIEASRHDADVVVVAADDHKSGDYTPYLYESGDRGRTWQSIRGDLPDGTIVWAIEQDHVVAELLFAGAEHGVHASVDGGVHWHKLTKDVPTISFRDLAIQRRDDDLVCASFGRGFYVLDDYSPLRRISEQTLAEPATLFPVRDAWWYVPYQPMQAPGQPTLGSTAFRTPNAPFGATFTYHLNDEIRTLRDERRADEKDLDESVADVPFPGWDRLYDEYLDVEPAVLLIVSDENGDPIRSIPAQTTAGLHRSTWDLRHPAPDPVALEAPGFKAPWETSPKGTLVVPGRYSVELVRVSSDSLDVLAGPEEFSVVPTPAVGDISAGDTDVFRRATADLVRRVTGAAERIVAARDRVVHLRAAILATPGGVALMPRLEDVHGRLESISCRLVGDPVREKLAEPAEPSIRGLVERVVTYHRDTTGPPTATQRFSVDRATAAFDSLAIELTSVVDVDLSAITADLDAAGGPWTPR
ncbi:MAG: glycosyl hydrolase [Actinomycetia bacterium]|nr:glycosyl hydrolase [Actinomycetes bacterium]